MSQQTVNGISMNYEIYGEEQPSCWPILLLHGLGSSLRDWEYQIEKFSSDFQVIALDIRGHGLSEKSTDEYSIALFADDVAAFLKKINIKKVNVVGLSMGGMIAFQLSLSHSDLIHSLVIVNSGPDFRLKNFSAKFKVRLRLFMLKYFSMKRVGRLVAKGLFPEKNQKALRQLFVGRFIENERQAYIKALKAILNWSVESQIAEITQPVLIVAADKDYTPVAHKKNYASKIPRAIINVISDSHHAVPVEKPEVFNRLVLDFLKTV
ncbi:MAG TPA: alpha/beta hydrolase [Aeromonadales bacterium]|nr:alpha/beta hydrolase [Aeromonadales bacterium]